MTAPPAGPAPPAAGIAALAAGIAATSPAPLQVRGGATKRAALGADSAGPPVLDTRALRGIVAYDPRECVITALGGTPVAEVRDAVGAHGQYLPWDPPFAGSGSTIGGMIAAGLSGPGRVRYGGVRDFVIGARVVDGRGRVITSGGHVVKNAAGFLLHHGLVGSRGAFGVIVEASLKVFPAPLATTTLVAQGTSPSEALAACGRLAAAALDLDALEFDDARAMVAVRLAGSPDALDDRCRRVAAVLGLPTTTCTGAEEAGLWTGLGLDGWAPGRPLVKVPATPTRVPALLDALRAEGDCRVSVGGSVLYVATSADLTAVSRTLTAHDATGVVVAGPGHGRALGVPRPPALFERVRRVLDPDGRFR